MLLLLAIQAYQQLTLPLTLVGAYDLVTVAVAAMMPILEAMLLREALMWAWRPLK